MANVPMNDNPIIGRGWHFPPEFDQRGSVRLVGGDDEIAQAIRIILETAPGERVMRPEFGCRIHELVFDPLNATTFGLVDAYVREALGRWEPRITVVAVNLPWDPGKEDRARLARGELHVKIEYRILATHNNRSLVFPFYAIPQEPPAAAQ